MTDGDKPEPLRSSRLEHAAPGATRHGFFTRVGGVSDGIYRGLNIGLGSNDHPALVRENRSRVAATLGVAEPHLLSVYQVHSSDVVVAREPFSGERPKADAIVTDRPGLAIGIATADCGPILFADAKAGVIGAAHAGWKGALSGVLENTIAAMERLGARRESIVAELGPAISASNYEVGPEFVARFLEQDADNAVYFTRDARPGHAHFDLSRYTTDRLRQAGVAAGALNRCTYGEEALFYSYRRSTHRREADYGRQISAIVLEA